jgi:hypothetical protein
LVTDLRLQRRRGNAVSDGMNLLASDRGGLYREVVVGSQ